MIAGEDYVFDRQKLKSMGDIYTFPEGRCVFDGAAPTSYTTFRENWILQRRLRPMIPCPENTPLPNRKISKDARAKRLSIYLRPWTLSKKLGTSLVPYILDLAASSSSTGEDAAAASSEVVVRPPWKEYLGRVLPHAARGVRSFLLTCLAEGRAADDDEEHNCSKGPAVVCDLSLANVHGAVSLSDKWISQAAE